MEQLPRRYESMDGLGRAKQDARAESNAGTVAVACAIFRAAAFRCTGMRDG